MPAIIFNGKSYQSIEEMPVNERQAYEQVMNILVDKNGNGIPDFLEGDIVKNVMSSFARSIKYNGQIYEGMNELPEDVRQKTEGAFNKMNEFGVLSAGASSMSAQANEAQIGQQTQTRSQPFISREYNPAIQEESGANWTTWILIGVVLMLCLGVAALGAFYFLSK